MADLFMNGERVAKLAAITVNADRKTDHYTGTILLRDVDWSALGKHQPRSIRSLTKIEIRAETPLNESNGEGPTHITLADAKLIQEGWGWAEDDQVNELAFTYVANLLTYHFAKED